MKQKWLLGGIILLALVLRVVGLEQYPAGFTPDEASFGYDAYSILKTGKDQWGHTLPLVLESFGDFKAPLYSYILIPFVGIFGLEKWVVRLPNALLGTIAIYITFLLVRELRKLSDKKLEIGNWKLEILTSALLTISPWHIMMSRGAFEANLTTFFLPLGIYLFLKGLKVNRYFSWAALALGLSLFTYHSAKLVTPLIVIFLIFIFKDRLRKMQLDKLIPSLIIFSIFLALSAYTFKLGAARRAQDVSIFAGALEEQAPMRLEAINRGMSPVVARLLHNKYQIVVKRFFYNYKQYYSTKFLFIDGPAETTYGMLPGNGALYSIEVLFLIGFIVALYSKRRSKALWLITFWLLIAPIPAALATGVGYAANRAVIMIPAIQIALAIGAFELLSILKRKIELIYLKGLVVVYLVLLLFLFSSFVKKYYFESQHISAQGMLYGNLEAAQWLAVNDNEKDKIIVSRRLSEPHIYIAFASKWDPAGYQEGTKNWNYLENNMTFVDQLPEYDLGKYVFGDVEGLEEDLGDIYVVGKPEEFGKEVKPQKIFFYPNGEPSIYIVDPAMSTYAFKN
jgi:4-amino-4-deoxy-L-arabinose transferase-like glycosyltransferase